MLGKAANNDHLVLVILLLTLFVSTIIVILYNLNDILLC